MKKKKKKKKHTCHPAENKVQIWSTAYTCMTLGKMANLQPLLPWLLNGDDDAYLSQLQQAAAETMWGWCLQGPSSWQLCSVSLVLNDLPQAAKGEWG